MCGIIGYVTQTKDLNTNRDLQHWFSQALYVDAIRGFDGTGAFTVGNNGLLDKMYKLPLPAQYFMEAKYGSDLFADSWPTAVIGHNRKATYGEVKEKHTHPFRHGKICLVHNGTLTNTFDLPLTHSYIDSNRIAAGIDQAKDPVDVLKRLEGAYALIWYNEDEKRMYFVRNKERPLFIGEADSDKERFLLFSSESWIMEGLANRNGLKIKESRILKEHVLAHIDVQSTEPLTIANLEAVSYKPIKRHTQVTNLFDQRPYNHHNTSVSDLTLTSLGLKAEMKVPCRMLDFEPETNNRKYGQVLYCIFNEKPCIGRAFHVSRKIYDKQKASIGWATVIGIARSSANAQIGATVVLKDWIPVKNIKDEALADMVRVFMEMPNKEEDSSEGEDVVLGPGGVFISASEWLDLVSDGCSQCGCALTKDMAGRIYWLTNKEPICKECYIHSEENK